MAESDCLKNDLLGVGRGAARKKILRWNLEPKTLSNHGMFGAQLELKPHMNFYMGNFENSLLVLNQEGDGQSDREGEGHLALAPEKPQLKRPSMYRVVMLNDDYTPMDFVVEVLMKFFNMSEEKATQVMLTVHTQGKAVCGVYTRDIAETKTAQVNQYSSECEHPLLCEIERAD